MTSSQTQINFRISASSTRRIEMHNQYATALSVFAEVGMTRAADAAEQRYNSCQQNCAIFREPQRV